METGRFPLQVEAEVRCSLGFERHAPASQAGWWGGPNGGAETKAESAAPNVIMQWSGSTNWGGAGCFVFSAGEVTRPRASLVPSSGAGPQ